MTQPAYDYPQVAAEGNNVHYGLTSPVSETEFSDPFSENNLFDMVTCFHYNNRVRLSFSLSAPYASHIVMLKGLIEFYRMHRKFEYDLRNASIQADIEPGELVDLKLFMSDVKVWLESEINFKMALKRVLEFEDRYRNERGKIYGALRSTVVPDVF